MFFQPKIQDLQRYEMRIFTAKPLNIQDLGTAFFSYSLYICVINYLKI